VGTTPAGTPFATHAGPLNLPNTNRSYWRLYSDETLVITQGTIERGISTTSPFAIVPTHVFPIRRVAFQGPTCAGTSLHSFFRGLHEVTGFYDLSYLDTSNVTTMARTFEGMSRLETLNLSNFDTRNVIDMTDMLAGMISLREITLGANFNFIGNVGLPPITPNATYTGLWTNGTLSLTSDELTTLANPQGTWVWQQRTGIDTLALQAVVALANLHTNSNLYTPASWTPFATARTAALTLLPDVNATQEQIDAATAALQTALDGLTRRAEFSLLQAMIGAVDRRHEVNYTPATWAALFAARTTAVEMVAALNATQQEVDAAFAELSATMHSLVPHPDRTTLQATLALANPRQELNYTPRSWAPFAPARVNAQAVLDNPNANQAEVNWATAALRDTMNALVIRADVTALQNLVNAANLRIEANYTTESWAHLVRALGYANAIINEPNESQAVVNARAAALQGALNALVHPIFDIQLIVEDEIVFSTETEGYAAISPRNVSIVNIGNQPTGEVTITLSGATPSAFTLSTTTIDNIAPYWSGSFTIAPALGLAPGIYTATVTVQTAHNTAQFDVTFTVHAIPPFRWSLWLLLRQVEVYHSRGFTPESWVPFAEARSHAQAVHDDPDAIQSQIDDAYDTLREARAGLDLMFLLWNPFEDIHRGQWFYYYVQAAFSNQIMLGTNPTTFSPYMSFSRAQAAVMFHRMMDDVEPIPFEPIFTDVHDERWHTDAIMWAAHNDLMRGVGYVAPSPGADSSDILGPAARWFDPHRDLMRVELAVFFHRYAAFLGHDTTVRQSERWSNYEDIHLLHSWGIDAMMWAEYHGLLSMRADNLLMPNAAAMRYEAAVVMTRFWDAFGW